MSQTDTCCALESPRWAFLCLTGSTYQQPQHGCRDHECRDSQVRAFSKLYEIERQFREIIRGIVVHSIGLEAWQTIARTFSGNRRVKCVISKFVPKFRTAYSSSQDEPLARVRNLKHNYKLSLGKFCAYFGVLKGAAVEYVGCQG